MSMFKVGHHVLLYVNRKVFKIDHIYKKAVWLDSGKECFDIVNIDDLQRIATPEEIAVGYRIDVQTKERPVSRRRKRKLSKQGKTVYWSKHLEQYVYVMGDRA